MSEANEPGTTGAYLPLRGVTILAWEQAVSLPMTTRLLGDLGAMVIRLEAPARGAPRPRHTGNDLARNKLGLALDLRSETGRDLFRRLVRKVDVVCENYTPRVKREFGLTYDELRQERPDLIMLSLSGYGQTGRMAERPTYGPGIEAASGHAQLTGYPDVPPTRPGTIVYADNISGFYAALAIVSALMRRRATGAGCFIDLSMYEANAFHLGLSLARSSLSGRSEPRRGNADPTAVVQDVYRCGPLPRAPSPARGGGAVSTDAAHVSTPFTGDENPHPSNATQGTPPLAGEGSGGRSESWLAVTVHRARADVLAGMLGCAADAGTLSAALAQWAAARTAKEAAAALQAIGVAAAPVLNARDLLLNEHLHQRQAFTPIRHEAPVNGYAAHPHAASPFLFVSRPRPPLREAPASGQDSRTVLRDLLGLPDGEIDALIERGVVGVADAAAPPAPSAPTAESAEKRLAWRVIAGYDPDPGRVLGLPPAAAEVQR